MKPEQLRAIVAKMDKRPWYSAESRWQSDCVLTGAPDAGAEPMGCVVVQANPNFPYRANLDGIVALANHGDALVELYEAVGRLAAYEDHELTSEQFEERLNAAVEAYRCVERIQ